MAVGAIPAWEPGGPLADAMLGARICLEEDSVCNKPVAYGLGGRGGHGGLRHSGLARVAFFK